MKSPEFPSIINFDESPLVTSDLTSTGSPENRLPDGNDRPASQKRPYAEFWTVVQHDAHPAAGRPAIPAAPEEKREKKNKKGREAVKKQPSKRWGRRDESGDLPMRAWGPRPPRARWRNGRRANHCAPPRRPRAGDGWSHAPCLPRPRQVLARGGQTRTTESSQRKLASTYAPPARRSGHTARAAAATIPGGPAAAASGRQRRTRGPWAWASSPTRSRYSRGHERKGKAGTGGGGAQPTHQPTEPTRQHAGALPVAIHTPYDSCGRTPTRSRKIHPPHRTPLRAAARPRAGVFFYSARFDLRVRYPHASSPPCAAAPAWTATRTIAAIVFSLLFPPSGFPDTIGQKTTARGQGECPR